jgi:hypothetical protein
MKDFKFLTKNDTLNLNGQMSLEAIQYLYDYTNNITRYEITTTIATYKIVDYTYGEGNIVAGTVNAYPLDTPDIRVTYKIRNQEVTEYTIDIDYFNTMGQMINTLRETQ